MAGVVIESGRGHVRVRALEYSIGGRWVAVVEVGQVTVYLNAEEVERVAAQLLVVGEQRAAV